MLEEGPSTNTEPEIKKAADLPQIIKDDIVVIKFLFAHEESASFEVPVPLAYTPKQLKEALVKNWPEKLVKVDTIDRLRLFCMGKELSSSKKDASLSQINLPRFATHPTPVNISVKPVPEEAPQKTKVRYVADCCVIC